MKPNTEQMDRVKKADGLLALFATKNAVSRGRIHPEPESKTTRLPYERDRDRIIHSNAFRRLQGKTQVFVAGTGDHYRNRLTHSMEVAQISRSMARMLRLNEDLAEAIALSHDLGHTPFGHSGEDALDECMRKHGARFEHNMQSHRVVSVLEHRYPNFFGLNLTHETLDGLAKHETPWDHPQGIEIQTSPSLEAQLVNFGDEIAYTSHDLDDGLRSRFFTVKQLKKLILIRETAHELKKTYGDFATDTEDIYRYQLVRLTIGLFVRSLVTETEQRINRHNIRTAADIEQCRFPLAGFPPSLEKGRTQLRSFLYNKFYLHPSVGKDRIRGQRMIKKLFAIFMKNPRLLPKQYRDRMDNPDPLVIVVKDHIASMTDAYAAKELERIGR